MPEQEPILKDVVERDVQDAVGEVYRKIATDSGFPIESIADRPECSPASKILVDVLSRKYPGQVKLMTYSRDDGHHQYVEINNKGTLFILDVTWRQFLYPEYRKPETPNAMYISRSELNAWLTKYQLTHSAFFWLKSQEGDWPTK